VFTALLACVQFDGRLRGVTPTVVHAAVEEQHLAWPDRTIALDLADEQLPTVADAHRQGQVITNFLTNALKYSAVDAPVAVSLARAGTRVRLGVRDCGPVLSAEQRAHIWDRFHRVPGIKQRSGSGACLGLGLYICRTIVERHHGEVGVGSKPGKGSPFRFTLPLAAPIDRGSVASRPVSLLHPQSCAGEGSVRRDCS
jgi:signal transduction histidine kinase